MRKVMVVVFLVLVSHGFCADLSDLTQMYGAYFLADKMFLVNHELGHEAEGGCGSNVEFNFSVFRSSGVTYSPAFTDKEHRLDVATAGFRASNELCYNSMRRLENVSDKLGQQTLAFTALLTMFDFPAYVAFQKSVSDGYGSESSDIAHIGEVLGKDDDYFNKRAIGVLLLNVINIKDLARAAAGKGYRKRRFRLIGSCDGETFWAGGTVNF